MYTVLQNGRSTAILTGNLLVCLPIASYNPLLTCRAEDASELLVKDNTRGSFPSLIAGLFNNEQRDFHFGHSATTRRLEFGTLLTVRIIPQSAVITTIHCLIYNSQHVDDKLQPQFESVKEEIQRGVQRFEREQKRLLNGDGSFPKRNFHRNS